MITILLIESIIVGITCFIIGTIIFNLSINKFNNQTNNIIKPYGINLSFFITGIILYFCMEIKHFIL